MQIKKVFALKHALCYYDSACIKAQNILIMKIRRQLLELTCCVHDHQT